MCSSGQWRDMLMCRSGQWWISSCDVVANGGYAQVQWWSMVDILMCKSDQLSICLCAVVVNGGYAHVQWWSMEGYAHVVAVNCQ